MRPAQLRELGAPAVLDAPRAHDVVRARVARFNATGPGEVLPALGTTHALWLALSTLLTPGDDVLVECPGYEPLWRIPEGMGANVRRFTRSFEDGFAASPETIAKGLTPRTKAVVLTSPHNPTGVRTPPGQLKAIAELCESVGARLLVDEVYGPFGSVLGDDCVWGETARHISPNIITVSGLSKAYGLGALRVGWIVADEAFVGRVEWALQSSLGDPPVAQMCLAAHVFSHLPALSAARERQFGAGVRAEVARWIAARPGLEWHEPEGGPFGFVHVRGASDLTRAIERGAEAHDVLVAPGRFFGCPNGFRLGWSVEPSQLTAALARLDRVLSPVLEQVHLAGAESEPKPPPAARGSTV